MNETLKQRLAGAIVLASLAVVLVPLLLDGEGLNAPEIGHRIPPAPALPAVPAIEAPVIQTPAATQQGLGSAETASTDPEPVASAPPPVPQPAARPAADSEPSVETPQRDAQGLPAGWQVRLASFAETANAEALVARLRRQGYKGYSRGLDSPQGRLTAVYVGPLLTRSEANTMRATLAEEFQLEGLVVRFQLDDAER